MIRPYNAGKLSFSRVQIDLRGTDTFVAEQARDVDDSHPGLKQVRRSARSH